MPKIINIDWNSQTLKNQKILLSLGFKKPKKVRNRKLLQYTNLKDKGVPVQIQRNISCSCCKSITVEFITSHVPKELVSKNREAITDFVRTCKKCRQILEKKPVQELVDMLIYAYRNYTYQERR